MRREKKRVLISLAMTGCLVFTTEFSSLAAETQSEAQAISTINHELEESPLETTWVQIPELADMAVDTQKWNGKALAYTDSETSVYSDSSDDSKVVGKMYKTTVVNVEEQGEEWTKISSGNVVGYVKNAELAFGTGAVERAKEISLAESKDAKTVEEIAKEEAAKKASQKRASYRGATSASVDEKTLLAALIYCEAGNQLYDGKVAVGAVVINRVNSGRFPNTIRQVIYQRGQFGPAITGKLDRVLASGNIPSSCYQAAESALSGYNPIGSALYFGCGNYGYKLGDHYFH